MARPTASSTFDYILTGSWGKYAAQEAAKFGEVHTVWDGKATNYDRLPKQADLKLDPQAAYAYYVSNETIQGVEFQSEPETGNVPLVCDASSDFLEPAGRHQEARHVLRLCPEERRARRA